MKATPGSVVLVLAFVGVFALEIVTQSVGNDAALLKLGALPDNGELNGQYWRFATYSFLHFNWAHLLVNSLLILWVGRILEKRIGTALTGAIYVCSVLSSAAVILLVHSWYPKMGATVGASGGMFGLVGATLGTFLPRCPVSRSSESFAHVALARSPHRIGHFVSSRD